jgi:hypothetical protein
MEDGTTRFHGRKERFPGFGAAAAVMPQLPVPPSPRPLAWDEARKCIRGCVCVSPSDCPCCDSHIQIPPWLVPYA